MSVYSRRSPDTGAPWDPETALTHAPEYTDFPSVYLNGANVDVPYGDRQTGQYDIYCLRSADFGARWAKKQQITKTDAMDLYPAAARDGSNVHIVWTGKEGVMYLHSVDGGATWGPAACLSEKGMGPFIAVAGDAVHVIFVSPRTVDRAAYYRRNPTGNRSVPAVPEVP